MKIAPWFLIAVLGLAFAGNARAEEPTGLQRAGVYAGVGCFHGATIGAIRGVFAEEFMRQTALGCVVGAAAGLTVGAVVESGVLSSDPAPTEAQLHEEDSGE